MLTIHFSHCYETLERLLVEQLGARAAAASDVFGVETVVVPSAAVRRRVTLALARADGICANVAFPYLARWLWECIARVVPGVQAESPFDPSLLVWRMHAALGDAAWAAPHPRLARYLRHADPTMRYELAQRLATLFDHYVTYRPDWLAAWSRGERVLDSAGRDATAAADEAWQAELWRRIAPGAAATPSPAEAYAAALGAKGAALVQAGAVPADVHVFALPTIAPLHLGLLQALGNCSAVHVYALNPCREFWFDCVEPRRLAYLAAQGRADAHHEVGNRLLAAWGRQAQAGLSLLVDACGEAGVDDARFDDAGDAGVVPPTLLAQLQRAILEMRDLEPGSVAPAAGDRSIELHVCHSLTRELEVLQDRLLGLFASDATLAPGEILVVTPDLEAAAPLIDSIFGTAPGERRIPYAVTGRTRTTANAPARILVELLALVASRCSASAVFGLLQQAPVARRFGLDADALQRIHGWLQEAGAHWALDAAHCESLGLPADGRHSFADALERLMLGHALHDEASAPFAGLLACGAVEGVSDTAALGALWRYVEALSALRRDLARAPLAPAAWAARLPQALHDFVEASDDEHEALQEAHAALRALAGEWERSGCDDLLELDLVRRAVATALEDPARGGVAGGGVTFSGMASLRGLPFRVICAVGLNDGAFPAADRPAEFDLLNAATGRARPGDRQRRIDERNVFLDLLLSARDVLHLSHVGRSVRDNARLPPSVLVSELLETLAPAVGGAAAARLVVEHPLQAFAVAALRVDGPDPRLRSFQREYAQALQQRLRTPAVAPATAGPENAGAEAEDDRLDDDDHEQDGARNEGPALPFFAAPLAAPGDEWLDVPLERLLAFLRHPGRFILQSRLRVHVARAAEELADEEPFAADVPTRSALADRLLPALLEGIDRARAAELARAGCDWPAGAVGAQTLAAEFDGLVVFADSLRPRLAEPVLAPFTVALDIDAAGRRWHLHGSLNDLRPSGLLRHRYDDLRAGDALSAWLHHLLLCAGAPTGVALRTTWFARDGSVALGPCDDARAQFAQLLALYARGLTEPLPFAPKSAWAYMRDDRNASSARAKWHATPQHPFGESADAGWRLALRGRPDPLAEDFGAFEECAATVFGPLLDCAETLP